MASFDVPDAANGQCTHLSPGERTDPLLLSGKAKQVKSVGASDEAWYARQMQELEKESEQVFFLKDAVVRKMWS